MLATIIIDAYKKDDTKDVLSSLERLTRIGNGNWSSAGVYSYWNYSTREVLYIGLAIDLVERFKQHNGISFAKPETCKKTEIENYFSANEKLGFTIMLQSSLSQPSTLALRKEFKNLQIDQSLFQPFGDDGQSSIKRLEGILLETYKRFNNRLPAWNKMGGSINGRNAAKASHGKLLQLFTETRPNKYVSRVSLRELADNPLFNDFESYLHSIRIMPLPSKAAIKIIDAQLGKSYFEMIGNTGYFKKTLAV